MSRKKARIGASVEGYAGHNTDQKKTDKVDDKTVVRATNTALDAATSITEDKPEFGVSPQSPEDKITSLERQIDEANKSLREMQVYVEKILHVCSTHFAAYSQRSARPYYPLDNGWALTHLSTGQPFFVNTEDRNLTPWIIMGGTWESNVDLPLLTYAQPGMRVLDIGAHIGYYTVKLGAKAGHTGRVMAFEPNPKVNRVCLENIKINGLTGMTTLHKFALGDKAGNATLTYSSSNMTSANLLGDQDADFSVGVGVFPLDDVVPEEMSIDLIKLDAEGYEARILEGAKSVLARSPQCAIMIELGLERWERSAPLENLLSICGGNKVAYAVRDDGTVELMELDKIRPFLLTCAFHENYFLIAPAEYAEKYIGRLIKR
jgi:FkbM family methyltransferase